MSRCTENRVVACFVGAVTLAVTYAACSFASLSFNLLEWHPISRGASLVMAFIVLCKTIDEFLE